MSLLQRLADLIHQKPRRAIDQAENPVEALDYSYQKQLEQLQKVKRNVADVLTSEKRLEIQAAQLQQQAGKMQGQARRALEQGREDLARIALTRAQMAQAQIVTLRDQVAQLREQEQRLAVMAQQLQAKVEAFRTQKEAMKAQYTAAQATARVGEAVTGMSEEMQDATLMVERARERTEAMQARAAAIDELVGSGALDQIGVGDDVEKQLQAATTEIQVEAQLEAMKNQLALPEAMLVVRIQGEGQYRLGAGQRSRLDTFDQQLTSAIETGDEAAFKKAVTEIAAFVRDQGTRLEADDLRPSDVVLPADDMSLTEAKQILRG